MLRWLGGISSRVSQQIIPSPFVFAIVLTLVTYVLGIVLTGGGPFEMVGFWYGGFWGLLEFAMQMTVILLFGYVLASSPPAKRMISTLARYPRSSSQAIVMITALAIIFGFVSWGLGLIVGAFAAREFATQCKARGIKLHYPLAAAAGFSGLIIFNAGFSASAPLLVATEGHFLEAEIGRIPISETILTPYNLITFGVFLLVIPLIYRAMHPRNEESIEEIDDALIDDSGTTPPAGPSSAVPKAGGSAVGQAVATEARTESTAPTRTFAERAENFKPLSWAIVAAGGTWIVYHFATNGFDLNLNMVNFILLILGLAAYDSPIAYVHAIDDGVRACGQIVLQFPFYAGIMGMMGDSGLVELFANWLVAISNEYTFPLAAMVSAGVVNFFVPSAGGQWAVQGPLLVQAAELIDADMGQTILAFGYGDQLTNALQPMWMLPLLGVTALKAREILGYTAVMMLAAFAIFGIGIAVLPLLF